MCTAMALLVGTYAQAAYLPQTRRLTMTERVRRAGEFGPFFPLPHPAWRSRLWMAKQPWFETDIIPLLQRTVAEAFG
jgi:uracil-DNA glycosylase